MARYRIAHDLDHTWLRYDETNQIYFWGEGYESAKLFSNYKEARAALETVEVEKRCYGFPYKPTFMKFYDSDEHRAKEEKYLENKKLLRDWGEI